MVKYRQGIAIIDTADPILFRFPPRADNGDLTVPSRRPLSPAPTLAESVAAMNEIRAEEKRQTEPKQVISEPETRNADDPSHRPKAESFANSPEVTRTAPATDTRIRVRHIEEDRDQSVLPFDSAKAVEEDEEDEPCAA
jgi:hypothetical protein